MIALHQKRAERALGKRSFAPCLIDQDARTSCPHRSIAKRCRRNRSARHYPMREDVPRASDSMWFHPANLAQLDSPLGQRRIGNELGKRFVVDRQNFGTTNAAASPIFSEQILNLPDPRKVFVVGAVLGQLQRRVVIRRARSSDRATFRTQALLPASAPIPLLCPSSP